MAENIAYAICGETKCKRPVYTQEYIDDNMPVVKYGANAPDDSEGKDGDIYIQIEE